MDLRKSTDKGEALRIWLPTYLCLYMII